MDRESERERCKAICEPFSSAQLNPPLRSRPADWAWSNTGSAAVEALHRGGPRCACVCVVVHACLSVCAPVCV